MSKLKLEDMTLEEKVDELLKHQRRNELWAKIRAITSLTLFIIFVVIPIVWSYLFIRKVFAVVDLDQFMDFLSNLQGPAFLQSITDGLNNLMH